MSDPMTNTEVEDVLSSIRRLVSDDKRAEAKAEPANDRLVLTPSLRVTEDQPAAPDAPSAEALSDDGPSEQEDAVTQDDALTHEDALASEQDVLTETDSFDHIKKPSDDGEETALNADLPSRFAPLEEMPWPGQEPAEASEDEGDAIHAETPFDDEVALTDLSALDVTEDDGALPEDHGDSAFSTQDGPYAGLENQDVADGRDETAASDALPDDSLPDETVIENDPAPYSAYGAQTLSAKIAALETLIAGRGDQWEPDDAGSDAYAGTDAPAMAWEDASREADTDASEDTQSFEPDAASTAQEHPELVIASDAGDGNAPVETPVVAQDVHAPDVQEPIDASDSSDEWHTAEELAQIKAHEAAEDLTAYEEAAVAASDQADTGTPNAAAPIFSTEEDLLDEEALRDLVADIVREELQGALGERITRNVRKLVRREIHRALAAQDLE